MQHEDILREKVEALPVLFDSVYARLIVQLVAVIKLHHSSVVSQG